MTNDKKEAEFVLEEGECPRDFIQRYMGGIELDPGDEIPDEVIEIKFVENTKNCLTKLLELW